MGVNTLEEQTVVPGYKTRCLLWCCVQLEGCAIVGKQARSVIRSLFTIGEKIFSWLTCSGMCQHVSLLDEIVINYGCIRRTNKNITYDISTRHLIKTINGNL